MLIMVVLTNYVDNESCDNDISDVLMMSYKEIENAARHNIIDSYRNEGGFFDDDNDDDGNDDEDDDNE